MLVTSSICIWRGGALTQSQQNRHLSSKQIEILRKKKNLLHHFLHHQRFVSEPAGCRFQTMWSLPRFLIKPGCLWYQDRQTLKGNATHFKSSQMFFFFFPNQDCLHLWNQAILYQGKLNKTCAAFRYIELKLKCMQKKDVMLLLLTVLLKESSDYQWRSRPDNTYQNTYNSRCAW